ncbi:unnamed protein product [Calypogeia fissa]
MLEYWEAHVGMALVMVIYGGYHVMTKLALTVGLAEIVFCVYRDVTALCILGPYGYFKEKRARPPVTRKLLYQFFFLGLTGVYGNQLLFTLGLSLTSPAVGAAFQPSVPVFTAVLAVLLGTEAWNFQRFDGKVKVGGIFLSVSGALLMALYKGPAIFGDGYDIDNYLGAVGGKPSPEPVGWFGSALISMGLSMWHVGIVCLVGNCMFLAVYFAYQAPVLKAYPHSLTVTAYSYFFGACLMVLTSVFSVSGIGAFSLTGTEIYSVLYAGIAASAINYMIMSYSNKVLGPSLVSLYMPLQPLTSAILSRAFLGSTIFLGNIIGGILILSGLFCTTWARNEADRILSRARLPVIEETRGETSISVKTPLLK